MSANKTETTAKLNLDVLEARDMMSVSSVTFANGIMTVTANNLATSVVVQSSGTSVQVKDTVTNQTWTRSGVTRVDFIGGSGNDSFRNNIANLATKAWGNGGNDYLEGYNGADYFVGGGGDDTLVGYGGKDTLFGEAGNDVLKGMDGDDQLMGGDHDDNLIGGAGKDSMWGGNGNDILIAIDNGYTDYCQGDGGRNAIWADASSLTWDAISAAASGASDKNQWVFGFANGADRTLNGDNIADPALKAGNVYKRFSGPLYSASGPTYTDIRQGNIGDCWLMAGLGAIAMDNPTSLKQNVVDFGDGTYGVRLGSKFYRVDGDLPALSASSTNTSAASLGAGGSLWAAVVEKAYAHHRTANGTTNSYNALDGGWSVEVNQAFGATSVGDYAISSYSTATSLGNAMYNAWNSYSAVTIGFLSVPSGAPLISSHMYQVVSFTRNSAGNVTHVTLRNPWGVDGVAYDSNPNDGLVTVSVNTLFACTGRVNWGQVS